MKTKPKSPTPSEIIPGVHTQWLWWMLFVLAALSISIADAQASSDSPTAVTAITVEAAVVRVGSISEFEFADGTSQAARREYLAFESSGRVIFLKTNREGRPLREGDRVQAGELLAKLDQRMQDADVRAALADLDTARAQLSNARKDFERAQRLRAGNAIETRRFEAIETGYQQALSHVRSAEARVDQAQAGQRQFQLRSPFDGVVAFLNVREGQYISLGQYDSTTERSAARTAPIVVIDPSTFEIVVDLPVLSGRRVRPGQAAFILDGESLAALQASGAPGDGHQSLISSLVPARVDSVSPAVDPEGRAIRARVVTDGGFEGLTDGAYVMLWIEIDRREQAVIAPMESLLYREETAFAFIVEADGETVTRRQVDVGLMGFEGFEVLSGLEPGDVVVTKGRHRLADGMKVRATKPNGASLR